MYFHLGRFSFIWAVKYIHRMGGHKRMMMNHAKEEGQECETFPSFSSSTTASVDKFHLICFFIFKKFKIDGANKSSRIQWFVKWSRRSQRNQLTNRVSSWRDRSRQVWRFTFSLTRSSKNKSRTPQRCFCLENTFIAVYFIFVSDLVPASSI